MRPEEGGGIGLRSEMDEVEADPCDMFVDIGMLVIEGRVPGLNGRGYGEGPHCPPSAPPVLGSRHKCDNNNKQCYQESNYRKHMLLLWRNGVPMSIEVLVCAKCCWQHSNNHTKVAPFTSAVPDGSSLCDGGSSVAGSRTDEKEGGGSHSCLLIEQWTVQMNPKRVPDSCVNSRGLLQAVRSYLHFSQLSAWYSSTGGKYPQNVSYRICVPGESFSNKFYNQPEQHLFPAANLSRGGSVKITVKAMPRCETIPKVECPLKGAVETVVSEIEGGCKIKTKKMAPDEKEDLRKNLAIQKLMESAKTFPSYRKDEPLLGDSLLDPPNSLQMYPKRYQSPSRSNSPVMEAPEPMMHHLDSGSRSSNTTRDWEPPEHCRRPSFSWRRDSRPVSPARFPGTSPPRRKCSFSKLVDDGAKPRDQPSTTVGDNFTEYGYVKQTLPHASNNQFSEFYPNRDSAELGLPFNKLDLGTQSTDMRHWRANAAERASRSDQGGPSNQAEYGVKSRCSGQRSAFEDQDSVKGCEFKDKGRCNTSEREGRDAQKALGVKAKRKKAGMGDAPWSGGSMGDIVDENSVWTTAAFALTTKETEEILSVLRQGTPPVKGNFQNWYRNKDKTVPSPVNQPSSTNKPSYETIVCDSNNARSAVKPTGGKEGRQQQPTGELNGNQLTVCLAINNNNEFGSNDSLINNLKNSKLTAEKQRILVKPLDESDFCPLNDSSSDEHDQSLESFHDAFDDVSAFYTTGSVGMDSGNGCSVSFEPGGEPLNPSNFERMDEDRETSPTPSDDGSVYSTPGCKTVPSANDKAKFRRSLHSAASMVFHSRTRLPLTSSPAPIRRGKRFDFDSSLNSINAIKNALFDKNPYQEGEGVGLEGIENRDPRIKLSTSAPAATANSLLGNFEESVLNGRLDPVSTVEGFTAEIGASGSFCPKHLTLPITVFFYTLCDTDKIASPYLGHINLGRKGYHVPKTGTVQVTLFNPHGTVVKMFVVMYNLSDMPVNSQTFLRQRTLYMPVGSSDDDPEARKWLRYLIHLRFASSKSGRIYLHTDVRLVVFRKSDLDAASVHSQGAFEMRSFTRGPTNPRFSPKK